MSTSTGEHIIAPSSSTDKATASFASSEKYTYLECRSLKELLPFEEEWRRLALNAIEPNPFYESWNVLAALKHLPHDEGVRFLLVFKADFSRSSGRSLCALFPLHLRKGYEGLKTRTLPIKTVSFWRHKYCYLCTPLIEERCGPGALDMLFQWLEASEARLMEFNFTPAQGSYFQQLIQRFHTLGTPSFTSDLHTRAFLTREVSAERFFEKHISGSDMREARRRERLLSKQGKIDYRVHRGEEAYPLIEDFIALESKSWKGSRQCDLMSAPEEAQYFREAARRALSEGRMEILALHLDDTPIAFKCNYCAAPGTYSFKISYDPQYAKLGPGILLEMEHIRRLHQSSVYHWTDSCAVYNNATFNRIYNQRFSVQDFVVGTGKGRGELILSTLPLARHCFRVAKRLIGHSQALRG